MRPFILMIQFLTRIPINIVLDCNEEDFKKGIYAFTTVGLILGGILVAVNYWLSYLYLDNWSIAIIIVLIHVILTGGLHLDGVADAADGLFSNRSPDRILEIMKDSRIGTNGVLALIFILALKVVGIHYFLDIQMVGALLAMPILGRFCVVIAFKFGNTPRKEGMGNLFIGHANISHILVNALVLFAVCLWKPFFFLASVITIGFTFIIIKWSSNKIKGITGDILGLIIECSEVVFLLSLIIVVVVCDGIF